MAALAAALEVALEVVSAERARFLRDHNVMPFLSWLSSGPVIHFVLSALAALSLAGLLQFAGRRSAVAAGLAALALTLSLGEAKEISDLSRNPWRMTPAELRDDSARDMGWNLAGAASGAGAWLVAVAGAAWLRRGMPSVLSDLRDRIPA